MSIRVEKKELIERIAKRSGSSATTVEKIVETLVEEIYESLKQGECVTLRNLGNFCVRPERDKCFFLLLLQGFKIGL